MAVELLRLLGFGLILPYGIFLAAVFSGTVQRKNVAELVIFSVMLLALQGLFYHFFGVETTEKVYPLLVHLPLLLYLWFRLKRTFGQALSGILIAYLCCQIPLWLGVCARLLTDSTLWQEIIYCASVVGCFALLVTLCATSVCAVVTRSRRSLLLFCTMPLAYYLFDYGFTVYSDILYAKAAFIIEFLPALMALFYVSFAFIYYYEVQKQSKNELQNTQLALQLSRLESEMSDIKLLQEQTAAYRHDMRHHFVMIANLLRNGSQEEALQYIANAEADVDKITPMHWCSNSTLDLLLSFFANKAEHENVDLQMDVKLPSQISIPETELCSIISNALENAIFAAAKMQENRTVSLRCSLRNNNLLLYVENPTCEEVLMKNGLPCSKQEGHGFGVRSIQLIAEKHRGCVLFDVKNGKFTVKVILPQK